jgi:hypothetical protein
MEVGSNVVIFVDLSTAFMCMCVGKCPTFAGFLINYIGHMAINLGLDQGISVGGCCSSWFMCLLLSMAMD